MTFWLNCVAGTAGAIVLLQLNESNASSEAKTRPGASDTDAAAATMNSFNCYPELLRVLGETILMLQGTAHAILSGSAAPASELNYSQQQACSQEDAPAIEKRHSDSLVLAVAILARCLQDPALSNQQVLQFCNRAGGAVDVAVPLHCAAYFTNRALCHLLVSTRTRVSGTAALAGAAALSVVVGDGVTSAVILSLQTAQQFSLLVLYASGSLGLLCSSCKPV